MLRLTSCSIELKKNDCSIFLNAVILFTNAPRLGTGILIIVIFNSYNALIIIMHHFSTLQSGNNQDLWVANATFGDLDNSIFAAKYR